MKTKAKALQSELAERVPFEQSGLREALAWSWNGDGEGGGEVKPLFNCYVNVLWQDTQSPTEKGEGEQMDLFTPYDLGDTADFVVRKGDQVVTEGATAVDALDTGFLAQENLFLDVARDVVGDLVSFGVRCNGGVMDESGARGFVEEVAREVGCVLEAMETEVENE